MYLAVGIHPFLQKARPFYLPPDLSIYTHSQNLRDKSKKKSKREREKKGKEKVFISR